MSNGSSLVRCALMRSPISLSTSGVMGVLPSLAMGIAPSHRAALRKGARFGHWPPTHTGMRGCCTGVGWNVTSSIRYSSPS